VPASAEIVNALPPEIGQLEVIDGAGHFPWLDRPDSFLSRVTKFVTAAGPR